MALSGGHALRGGRLRKPERAPPARVLHHRALGNSGIHAGTEKHHRSDRALVGEIAADTGAVRGVQVRVREAEVNFALKVRSGASADLETWAVEKESSYFREVFGRELSAAAE